MKLSEFMKRHSLEWNIKEAYNVFDEWVGYKVGFKNISMNNHLLDSYVIGKNILAAKFNFIFHISRQLIKNEKGEIFRFPGIENKSYNKWNKRLYG
jgi:hypothetical protein